MIQSALSLVRNHPDPLAFLIAGVMLVAYECGIVVVTEDIMLGAFMVAAAARSMIKTRSLSGTVDVDLDDAGDCDACDVDDCTSCDDAEAPDAPPDAPQ